jgi:hypothetical protein
MRRIVVLAIAGLAGCGGGGGDAAAPTPPTTTLAPAPPVQDSRTFVGTTRATGLLSCGGDSHDLQTREGTIAVTLVDSTDKITLVLQVCADGIDNNDCTINQTRILVGQTLSGPRKGGTRQNVKLLTPNCGGGGPPPDGPVAYTVSVSYFR